MIRERNRTAAGSARGVTITAIALTMLAPGQIARAQVPGSVQDYRLPPSAPSPRPTAAGPVDSDYPIAAPTRPAGAPQPQPAPTASPAISLPPAAQPAIPRVEAARPRPSPAPSPAMRPPEAPPNATPQPSDVSAAVPAPMTTAPATIATPTAAPVAAVPPQATAASEGLPWAWIGGLLAIASLLLGVLLLRRRRNADEGHETAAPPPPPTAEPGPPAQLSASATSGTPLPASQPPAPMPEPDPVPGTPAQRDARPLEVRFEARHLSRAMVNASLAYRLTVTNSGAAAHGPLRIAGDIISAHGSLSSQDQLTPPSEGLAAIHQVPGLGPNETLTLSGELRLPLASILPIHTGGSRVFVPLARFRFESDGSAAETHVFVVGQASDEPGGALRPFPLDRGPGVVRELGQRELGLPA